MLVNAPLVNQLAPNENGVVDRNAQADCVSASLGAAADALLGDHFGGGDLKDRVPAYGPQYQGATDPAAYIPLLASLGIRMWEVQGDGDALVQVVHQQLSQGHPVTGAIPSSWGNTTAAQIAANGGPTHEILFCDAGNGWLTAMNPWPVDGRNAFYQTMADSWWASRLVYGRAFPLERIASMAFTRLPDGSAQDDQTHVILHFGMANHVLSKNVQQHALMAEAYYDGSNSFVPFDGGLVLTYNKAENAVRDDRAGQTVQALYNALMAAKAGAASDPKLQALHGVVQHVISELQAAQ